jgi:hypothetical protein
MRARVEIQTTEFSFEDFPSAWAVLSGVYDDPPSDRGKGCCSGKNVADGDGLVISLTGLYVIGTR